MKLNHYEQAILEGWEEIHKKSQLSLWILLALKEGSKHMTEIKAFIGRATGQTLSADDKSMYRALRRFNEADLICHAAEPSQNGPDRKVYSLTETGRRVLATFVQRNVIQVFYNPMNKRLIERSQ